jgi:hypothetical protein
MSIDPEFAEMMTETVTIGTTTATDGYGKRTQTGTTSILCRLVFEVTQRVDGQGKDVVETGRAICYGAYPAVTVKDVLTLPDGSQPSIISVDTVKDLGGVDSHTVIRFGR